MTDASAAVEIYSTAVCPYCDRAKSLLDNRGVAWVERRIDQDPQLHQQMLERSGGRRTVPQIFIHGTHVGGFDELAEAQHSGRLDELLAAG